MMCHSCDFLDSIVSGHCSTKIVISELVFFHRNIMTLIVVVRQGCTTYGLPCLLYNKENYPVLYWYFLCSAALRAVFHAKGILKFVLCHEYKQVEAQITFNRWQFACHYACCLLPLVSEHWTTGFRQEMQYFSLSECTTCNVIAMKNLRSTNYFSLLEYIVAWCDCFLITSRGCHNSHFHSNACLC